MKLLTLFKDKFHLAAICSKRDACDLVDYLSGVDSADKVSMVRLLERTSEHGPPRNKEKSSYLEGKNEKFRTSR